MSDIVERLSSHRRGVCSPPQNYCRNNCVMDEAAVEIEKLADQRAELLAALKKAVADQWVQP